jgi:hypothetical protein
MGFIYKIEVGGELYIGSTKLKYLCQRQTEHNQALKNPKNTHYNGPLYRFCREHDVSKIICEFIEEVDDTELRILEQEYMNKLKPTLNIRRAYRTEEERLEYHKKHNKIKSNCPICGKEMIKNILKRHIKNIH